MSTRFERAIVRRHQLGCFPHHYTSRVRVTRSGKYADGAYAVNIMFSGNNVEWELDILPESFELLLQEMLRTNREKTLRAMATVLSGLANEDASA